jgi:hypothetical protein
MPQNRRVKAPSWPRSSSPGDAQQRERRDLFVTAHPTSLLAKYAKEERGCSSFGYNHNVCDAFPNVETLRRTLDSYGVSRTPHAFDALNRRNDTLLVHLGAGDRSFDRMSLVDIAKIASRFKAVRLLGAAHDDRRGGFAISTSAESYVREVVNAIQVLGGGCKTTYHASNSPEDDMYQIYRASNFIPTQGGFSALGAIATRGNVFFTNNFAQERSDDFARLVQQTAASLVNIE